MVVFPIHYPQVLVLEMGIDRPGDMEYLLSFVSVNIGVVTQISSSHIAFFGSLGNIAKEKGKLLAGLPDDGFAILNFDDKYVIKMQEKTNAKAVTYGFGNGAMLHIDNLLFHRDVKKVEGFSFKLNYAGKTIPVRLPKIVALHHISGALAAAAVGVALKMNLVEIANALEDFEPLPGRLRLLMGKNRTMLLDDTYNASPASTQAALETLKEFMAPRKVIFLGDMLELGADAGQEHAALKDAVVASGAHVVVTVGKHMHSLYEALRVSGFSSRQVYWFPDPYTVRDSLETMVRIDDLILIKGSQGMRMEKVTEALIANPKDVKTLLCRQSKEWRKRPFIAPEEWSNDDLHI
jgi:UDP-N-acetylmuramoyl-tripeptide--D-alanyl-D-alanine ligase